MYSSIALLLGHMVGDYWFQSHKMAVNKSKKGGEGRLWCHLHCLIYSICVSLFVIFGGWRVDFLNANLHVTWEILFGSLLFAFLIAYITHYPIDRISFASKWMKWFGSTDFEKAPPKADNFDGSINIRSFFVAPIYIIIDNSMHLTLMYILLSLLGK